MESPEYVVLAVVVVPAVVNAPPVIVLDAAIVVAPAIAPDDIVAVPSVNDPPVIAPEPVIVVAPAIAPDEIVAVPSVSDPPVIAPDPVIVVAPDMAPEAILAVPSVNEPPVIAPEAVIATAPVTVPSEDINAPSVIVPAVTKLPPVTLPVTVIAGVVILDVLIVVAKDASDVAENSCIVPDAFTLTCEVPLARTDPEVVELPFNIAFVESSALKISNVLLTSLNINDPTCNTFPCTSENIAVPDPNVCVAFAVGNMFPVTVELNVNTPCASAGPANTMDPVPAGSNVMFPFVFVDAIVFDAT